MLTFIITLLYRRVRIPQSLIEISEIRFIHSHYLPFPCSQFIPHSFPFQFPSFSLIFILVAFPLGYYHSDPIPKQTQQNNASSRRSSNGKRQFHRKLDVSLWKIKVLKSPFTVLENPTNIFVQSSFIMLCQLWWNSAMVHKSQLEGHTGLVYSLMQVYNGKKNLWEFFSTGIDVIPIPVYVHSHSFPFPRCSLISIPIGNPFPMVISNH